jgi:hypothetical protein
VKSASRSFGLPKLGSHGSGPGRGALALFPGMGAALAGLGRPLGKVKPLSARRPFQTSLMGPLAEALERQDGLRGHLRPFRHPVYSAVHGGGLSAPGEAWRLLEEDLSRPQGFDLALEAARRDGHVRPVELGPCGTLERAVRFLGRDEVEIECFPTASASVRRRRVRQW